MEKLRKLVGLRHKYIKVFADDSETYTLGGNQGWAELNIENQHMKLYGCGVIACADLYCYLTGKLQLQRSEYIHIANEIQKYCKLIPKLGLLGPLMASGLKSYLLEKHIISPKNGIYWSKSNHRAFIQLLALQLEHSIPVIMSVGPKILPGKQKAPKFYKVHNFGHDYESVDVASLESRSKVVYGHYVIAIGLYRDDKNDEYYIHCISWGSEYLINYKVFKQYSKKRSPWIFSNMLLIK